MRRVLAVLVLAILGTAAGLAIHAVLDQPEAVPRISVQAGPQTVELEPATTLGTAIANLGLEPEPGDLLDVAREVIRADVYPGRVLLNNVRAELSTPLANGDRITIVDGIDQVEPIVREVVPVPEGRPAEPQFVLALVPGEQVTAHGEVSGKPVFAYFRPTGPARVEPVVALTFDDGPWQSSTRKILRTLERLHAPATFFMIGSEAEKRPRLVRALLRAGMAIGNHTYAHPVSPPFGTLSRREAGAEMDRCTEALEALGVHPALFRPPGGSSSDRVLAAARRRGLRVVLWSVDPEDWRAGTTRKQIVRRVLEAVQPGSIVLLHDGGGDRSATVRALPAIVRGIRAKGLRLVAITP
jgi:peptidoglycan/xylan/chitin deacetylase (PgdA/CDA1 family)